MCGAHILVDKASLGCRTHASEQAGIHGVVGSYPHCPWWEVLALFTACALLQAKRSLPPVPTETGTFVHLCCVVAENVTLKHTGPDVHLHSEPSITFHHCRVGFTVCDGLSPHEKQVLHHSTVPAVHLFLQSQLVSVLSEPSQELCLPPLELMTSHMNDHKNILSHSSAWSLSPLHPKPQTYQELGNGDEELNHILLCVWKKHSKQTHFVGSSNNQFSVGPNASEWQIPFELSLKLYFISIIDMAMSNLFTN